MTNIAEAIQDSNLLGAALGDLASWQTWLAVLKAAFGLTLNRQDRRAFEAVAQRKSPARRVRELWSLVGRRSGKSRIAAIIAVFIACFVPHRLAAGEIGTVLVLSPSRDQARVVFNYALGALRASPVLSQEIAGEPTAEEIRLKSGVVIAIQTASFRTIRGRTILAAILDECAFFRDDTSANPDIEIYTAILPALATTNGMLIGISTGYRRAGLLYQKHRDHFGQDHADVLVIAGSTELFNPTINTATIEAAREADPEAAAAEWDGTFRNDLSAFLDETTIESAIDYSRPLELPPQPGIRYVAFADPSGGRNDYYGLCIGHHDGNRIIADVVRGARPPFDPASVTAEYAALAKSYGVREVIGDNYAAEWAAAAWKDAGLNYIRSELTASELCLEALPEFSRGTVSIPHHRELVRELRLLERRTTRAGRDMIGHPPHGHDDHAVSLCGMIRNATKPKQQVGIGTHPIGGGAMHVKGASAGRSWRRGTVISAVDGRMIEKDRCRFTT